MFAPVTKKDIESRQLVPEGTYHLRIAKAEAKAPKDATNNGDGTYTDADGKRQYPYLSLQYVVKDEGSEWLGSSIFDMMPLEPGQMYRLSALLEKIGMIDKNTSDDWSFGPDDVPEMVGREFLGVVTVRKGQKGYPDRNGIARFLDLV